MTAPTPGPVHDDPTAGLVEEVARRAALLADVPVDQHPQVFAEVHALLADALGRLDGV